MCRRRTNRTGLGVWLIDMAQGMAAVVAGAVDGDEDGLSGE